MLTIVELKKITCFYNMAIHILRAKWKRRHCLGKLFLRSGEWYVSKCLETRYQIKQKSSFVACATFFCDINTVMAGLKLPTRHYWIQKEKVPQVCPCELTWAGACFCQHSRSRASRIERHPENMTQIETLIVKSLAVIMVCST